MVKPQFEIGMPRLPKTGVVVDLQQRREAVTTVIEDVLKQGLTPRGVATSPLPGQDGNREYFFWASHDFDGQPGYMSTEATHWFDTQHVHCTDEHSPSYPDRA